MGDSFDPSKVVMDELLGGGARKTSEQALAKLEELPDEAKQSIAASLIERLLDEQDDRRRAWIISALTIAGVPGTVDIVAARLLPSEPSEWVRYRAAISLAKMQPDNLKDHLEAALEDKSALVRAVVLRLLIENESMKYIEPLLQMARGSDWVNRKAAIKVLRSNAGHRPFNEMVESRFVPLLVACLHDSYELKDCQYQAARALGNMKHKWSDAIHVLGESLAKGLPDRVRRACIDALHEIGRPETRQALLVALQDKDAEVRVQAANALKNALGVSEAVSFVAEELLRREEPPAEYYDALRQVDSKGAANFLKNNLLHPDSRIAQRAMRALTELGGEEAIRTLEAQRAKALDTYTKLLGDADEQVMKQFNRLMKQAHHAFSMSMWMHGIIFGIGAVVLMASLYVALSRGFETFERYVGAGAAAGSLGILLLSFYKDPLKNIRRSVTSLIEINVVFLGYVRQINQIDATFKQMFLTSAGSGIDQMKQTVRQIQDSVKKTMEEVKVHLGAE